MNIHCSIAIMLGMALFAPFAASAVTHEEDVKAFEEMFNTGPQEEDVYRSDRFLVSATKHILEVSEAPAIATVITANDIRIMGARNLVDILECIPGIGITRGHYSVYSIEIRGIKAIRQNKIKFMVDGHAVNMPTTGDPGWNIEDIALEQIERVEVIRGPGSALYGANAFTGIINVVTKLGNELNGTQVTAGGGTFDTGRSNILHGKRYGNVDVLASLAYSTTEGAQLDVESDVLGRYGTTDDWARVWDGTFKISWEELVLNTRYTSRKNGPYVGVTNVVNDDSELNSDQFFIDLSYTSEITEQWNLNARAYYDYADIEFAWQLFPPGMTFSPMSVHYFPDGVYGTPAFKNRIYGAEIATDFVLPDSNTLTAGVVYEFSKQYDITHHANFHPLTFFNLGSYQDISSWGNWNIEGDRTNLAAYIQDEWKVVDNVALTFGLRHDYFDDVGNSTNPRLGLVWKMIEDLNLKLLYGQAFRVPTFDELYSINNPASVGNTDLQPEEMETYEISVGYNPYKGPRFTVAGFYNKFKDKIDLVPTDTPGMLMFRNTDNATIYGVELESSYRFRELEMYGNYYWAHPEDDNTGEQLPEVPTYRWNLGLNFWMTNWGKGNLHVLHVGDRERAQSDMRDALDAYTVVNVSFTVMNLFKTMELRATVNNIFDEQYAYPAPPATLANDYPAPGTSYFLEVRYTF